MMTFLNVLNFGDQGKCDDIVEWSQCSSWYYSSDSESNLQHLKITWKSQISKPF